MKTLFVAGLLLVAFNVSAEDYRLPFQGRWFVAQGGDTPNVNQHMSVRAQWFGIDFMKVGGPTGRALTEAEHPAAADFYSWGQEVLAPVDGTVESVVDALPDNPVGTKDLKNPAGNHVVIAAASDRFVFIAHMQRGSIRVKQGQRVRAGDLLGLCGNSGNSDAPHIHMHVQDSPTPNQGNGQNVTFKRINVELSGKTFQGVDWPLIRGLFVWN